MSRTRLHFWVALASGLTVLMVAVVDLRGASPGPLSTVHERVPELSGRLGCNDCHGGFMQEMSGACLDCHEEIQIHLESSAGLHGALEDAQAQACGICHSEHHGATFQLVNAQSFIMASARSPEEFDHAFVGVDLQGAHLELGCIECHENASVSVLEEGQHRFLGLDRDCASCHEDPHDGAMQLSCNACHVQTDFGDVGLPRHSEFLHLTGGHAGLSCRECHAQGDPHALEAMGGLRKAAPRHCESCHASPHSTSFVDGIALLASLAPEDTCLGCHAAEHVGFAAAGSVLAPEQHARSGFPIDAPHDGLDCAACHDSAHADFDARYPGRRSDDCAACHADPHGEQFAGGPFGEAGCIACHEPHGFDPPRFGAEQHERAALPLTDSHLGLECFECHADPAAGEPRVFRGMSSECESCHDDAHGGAFDPAAAGAGAVAHGLCAHCHRATAFDDVARDDFNHHRWTGFGVVGAHAQAECETCHVPATEADAFGRTFGRVEDAFGAFAGCVTCHEDPHGGTFDTPDRPSVIDGRSDCARCHQEDSFRVLRRDFDHARWTGFPLEGGHAHVACTDCHLPSGWLESGRRTESQASRSWSAARGVECAACHASPHGGQFDRGGPSDCAHCHNVGDDFHDLVFNHNRDTRFPLGRGHAALSCDACHKPWVQGDVDIVRYRGLGTECTDCHGVHRDQLRSSRGKRQ